MELKSKHRRIKNLETDNEAKSLIVQRIRAEMKVLEELIFKYDEQGKAKRSDKITN